eukprot:11550980-Alexandrium_andersonii.AAC.1
MGQGLSAGFPCLAEGCLVGPSGNAADRGDLCDVLQVAHAQEVGCAGGKPRRAAPIPWVGP